MRTFIKRTCALSTALVKPFGILAHTIAFKDNGSTTNAVTAFIVPILCLAANICCGQSAVSSAGAEGTGTGGSMSFTIGLPDHFETTGTGGTARLGVQQGYDQGLMWTGQPPPIGRWAATVVKACTPVLLYKFPSPNLCRVTDGGWFECQL